MLDPTKNILVCLLDLCFCGTLTQQPLNWPKQVPNNLKDSKMDSSMVSQNSNL